MSVDFKRTRSSHPVIELTPLIDIIFQLLIFFMITSSVAQSSIELQLPQMAAQTPLQEKPLSTLSVLADATLRLNDQAIPFANLKQALSEVALSHVPLYLEADQSIPYEKILNILKQIRESGIQTVHFLHELD
jgi:biopolymer transport protein ExbD